MPDTTAAGRRLNLLAPRSRGRRWQPDINFYPEREEPRHHWLDPAEAVARYAWDRISSPLLRSRLGRLTRRVRRLGNEVAQLSDEELDRRVAEMRVRIRRLGLMDASVVLSFALIREMARRTLGLYPHDVQVLGAMAMIHGAVAEMETGEGKTLTATLAVGTAALAGIPTHVVTVNDYLARRDAENLGPLYARLRLDVGTIVHGVPPDERREIYRRAVVYASNKEIAFDYLRDRVRLGGPPQPTRLKIRATLEPDRLTDPPVMRGLHFAIVDEADSVLVDEARTPLILSRETDAAVERAWAEKAHGLADSLLERRDYRLLHRDRRVEFTRQGQDRLEQLCRGSGEEWSNKIRREQAVRQALSARNFFRKGEHYIIADGKVVIVDEYTGRVMDERSWNDGMHQLIEVKESVEVTPRKEVLARMTYQRFFRRYRRLAGMTGTAREIAAELSSVYRLSTVRIPTNRPSRRLRLGQKVLPTVRDKWQAVARRVQEMRTLGRPVLVGTRSVSASEELSRQLMELGIPHQLLNAKNDEQEAKIIARAGDKGQVTVATNMAGRGVDIALGEGVAEIGGLHVILTERHDAKRIDRQLEGRTARRGEPGSSEAILSFEDPILQVTGVPRGLIAGTSRLPGTVGHIAAAVLFKRAQRRAERDHARARRALLDHDRRLGVMLAFAGKPE